MWNKTDLTCVDVPKSAEKDLWSTLVPPDSEVRFFLDATWLSSFVPGTPVATRSLVCRMSYADTNFVFYTRRD